MPTFNTTDPKPGYVYDTDTDTWFPLLGIATSQTLDGLSDVVLTSPTTNQSLVYNGTNWVNSTEVGDISGVTAGTGISGGGTSGTVTVSIDTAVTADLTTAQTLSAKTMSSPVFIGPEERFNIVASAATGTINIDFLTAGVWYYTSNATANHTLNLRGNGSTTMNTALAVGDSTTILWLNTNGSTAYYPNVIQVDGSTVTPKWSGGTAPSAGNASSIDGYSFTVVKTANATFTVLGAGAVKYA
jgi:hypothetical protein